MKCKQEEWLPLVVSFGWLGARSGLYPASFLFVRSVHCVW
jgi:hypothetical protein